jgi:hypothetical protein
MKAKPQRLPHRNEKPLAPTKSLLVKLGSIVVHTSAMVADHGDDDDGLTLAIMIRDSEVQAWLDGMQRLALLPVKRS